MENLNGSNLNPEEIGKEAKDNSKKTIWSSIWELVRFAIMAVIIVVPIRMFVAQPFIVSGSSMYPTLLDGDYLVIDEISYQLENPNRFDVVVFRYPKDTTKYFIKRVIGLPGEIVDIKGSEVKIINKENPDGFKIDQPYVKNPGDNNMRYELNDGEYFVMGDNRAQSSDSRLWGPVKENLFVGRALLRLLPFKDMQIWPGKFNE